jgi:HK97 family phage prohead protease
MGFWRTAGRRLFRFSGESSESEPMPIDRLVYLINGGGEFPVANRAEALTVTSVLRGRNLICSIATLPLVQYSPDRLRSPLSLLTQIDPNVANSVTIAETVEDLLFEGTSWWEITQFGADGYPVNATHRAPSSVSLLPPGTNRSPAPLPSGLDPWQASVWVDGHEVSTLSMIRFDSPNPPLLKSAGRAVRQAVMLDRMATMYSENPRPLDYFSPSDPTSDPVDDDSVAEILRNWNESRRKRSTAYVPAALRYNVVDTPTPADLQLVELQKRADLAIANALGLDPEDLGVSTTSRTYANDVDRRQDRVNDTLAPYMKAITDRLSMADVTKRGYCVEFDLDDYLRADPVARWGTYQTAWDMGAMTIEEIRVKEGLSIKPAPGMGTLKAPTPPPAIEAAPADPAATDPGQPTEGQRVPQPVAASGAPEVTLAADTELFEADVPVERFAASAEKRVISGLALPYGRVAVKNGRRFRFLPGSIEWSELSRVKLLRDHDFSQAIGRAIDIQDTDGGLQVTFKVARGPDGDKALALAEDGVTDGFSVGVDILDAVPDPNNRGVMLVRRALLSEVSLLAMPAFDDARVTHVAASRDGGKSMDPEDTTAEGTEGADQPTEEAAGGVTLSREQLTTLLEHPGALAALSGSLTPATPATPAGALTLSREQLDALIANGGLGALLGMPNLAAPRQQPEQRQAVNPIRRTAQTAVAEEAPYRFDRRGNLTRGSRYDFSSDVIAGLRDGDTEAIERAQTFMRAQFDTDMADAATLNPNINRPDLYVDQKEFAYPIWDAINKGTIADATPFVLPKFSSSSGLVAAHTEATEPTAGSFTATSQTITPSAVSGKVSITREAWDQGGNPQLSGLIWTQMVRGWFEALEAAAVAALNALTPTGITLTAGAVNAALVGQLEGELAALQFVRGGMRMRDFFIQVDLYKALIGAVDGDGRKLLPMIGPVNANGQTSEFFADVMIGGLRGRPEWALAATGSVAASSYLFDRASMSGWATAPQRLTFQDVEVRYVHLGIWGYKALANTDLTGVREVIYDPAA